MQTANGFVNEPIDITASFKAIIDLENVETGWMDFPPNSAPSFVLMPLASLATTPMPPAPSAKHKNGVRILLKLATSCAGDKPVREIAGTAKSFLSGVEELYTKYQADAAKYPGSLPAITLVNTIPIKSGSGQQQSTNYKPVFQIAGWVKRPADLIYLRPSAAPVEPLKTATNGTGAPSTGGQTVPPPNQMHNLADDFG